MVLPRHCRFTTTVAAEVDIAAGVDILLRIVDKLVDFAVIAGGVDPNAKSDKVRRVLVAKQLTAVVQQRPDELLSPQRSSPQQST